MTEITEQQIKSYLLGELPEEEAEHLEECLFTDEGLFSEVQAAEMSLVDGYVRNELPHDERARFESRYLVTPERRQKVSDTRLFHDELNAIRPVPEIVPEKAGWFERMLGGRRLSVMQYASAALILLLAISTGWLFYDGWKTRNELAMARSSLANSQIVLEERLAEKEKELNENVAQQRGEDSDSLSALQTEADSLRRQLEDERRKSSNTNTSIPPSPSIATIFLPLARGGATPITTVTITKETKVLNVRIPIAADDGETFEVVVKQDGIPLMTKSAVKATGGAEGKFLGLILPSRAISAGKYDIVLKNNSGIEKIRSFMVDVK